ncbi:serine/threonine-protein kinase pim-2-like isoform X2 [Oreochromis aureus]|uniref:Serine/threonine-protein kinase n=1 Tax=Oreochromis aureus TaxID=47969 RepID=A0A668TII9_OREAU|nr:serine/threonine-protein kinase pim-2-like isoform X2 [Oreochromis aureus]
MSGDKEQASSLLDSGKDLNNKQVCAKNGKRKAMGDNRESPKKKKKNVDQDKKISGRPKREFQARYVEEHQLGEGGCGAVFAGYRIEDRFPDESGKKLSVEVAIMVKLAGEAEGSVGISAPVSLLEWFDLGKELILVLERPVPAVDLQKYKAENGRTLTEDKAKVILKQLVDAVKELEDKHIFHRDIKGQNILIETGSDVPRVRIIDFGLSCFVKQRSLYRIFYGTPLHIPPEWYIRSCYRCGPTTVWQMGVVLYEALHARYFSTARFLTKKLSIKKRLSTECRNFLDACLAIVPEKRPTLEELQLHPWLR